MPDLPNPNRRACASLPAELIAHILHLAQEGQSAADAVQTRFTFERVCRSWFACDFRWRMVAVSGFENVNKLLHALDALDAELERGKIASAGGAAVGKGEGVGRKIKSIAVKLVKKRAPRGDSSVSKLFAAAPNVERVEFLLDCAANPRRGDDRLDGSVRDALGKLEKVKHFALIGYKDAYPDFSLSRAKVFMTNWSELTSIKVNKCRLNSNGSIDGLLDRSPPLRSLEFVHNRAFGNVLAALGDKLKPGLRELTMDYKLLHDSDWDGHLPSDVIKNLQSLTLTDGQAKYYHSRRERGHLDELLANLREVSSLKISPVAISDFASFARLTKLISLRLREGCMLPMTRVEPSELISLFNNSHSLKRVYIPNAVSQRWSDQEKRDIKEAAKPHIKFA